MADRDHSPVAAASRLFRGPARRYPAAFAARGLLVSEIARLKVGHAKKFDRDPLTTFSSRTSTKLSNLLTLEIVVFRTVPAYTY